MVGRDFELGASQVPAGDLSGAGHQIDCTVLVQASKVLAGRLMCLGGDWGKGFLEPLPREPPR